MVGNLAYEWEIEDWVGWMLGRLDVGPMQVEVAWYLTHLYILDGLFRPGGAFFRSDLAASVGMRVGVKVDGQ